MPFCPPCIQCWRPVASRHHGPRAPPWVPSCPGLPSVLVTPSLFLITSQGSPAQAASRGLPRTAQVPTSPFGLLFSVHLFNRGVSDVPGTVRGSREPAVCTWPGKVLPPGSLALGGDRQASAGSLHICNGTALWGKAGGAGACAQENGRERYLQHCGEWKRACWWAHEQSLIRGGVGGVEEASRAAEGGGSRQRTEEPTQDVQGSRVTAGWLRHSEGRRAGRATGRRPV